jgi:hypothetical protein
MQARLCLPPRDLILIVLVNSGLLLSPETRWRMVMGARECSSMAWRRPPHAHRETLATMVSFHLELARRLPIPRRSRCHPAAVASDRRGLRPVEPQSAGWGRRGRSAEQEGGRRMPGWRRRGDWGERRGRGLGEASPAGYLTREAGPGGLYRTHG